MLGIKEFSQLNFEKQCSILTFKGKLMAKKAFGVHQVYLFSIGNFFAEVWFNGIRNEIHGINSFSTIKGLDMYTEDLDISEVELILKGNSR